MTQAEIEAKVIEIITQEFGFNPGQVLKTDKFFDDLGMDSLDIVELVLSVEEHFSIEIPDNAWDSQEGMSTVQDAINYLVDKKVDPPRY